MQLSDRIPAGAGMTVGADSGWRNGIPACAGMTVACRWDDGTPPVSPAAAWVLRWRFLLGLGWCQALSGGVRQSVGVR